MDADAAQVMIVRGAARPVSEPASAATTAPGETISDRAEAAARR